MNITITGKNIAVTDALKETIDKKLARLDKYFQTSPDATVTLGVEKLRHMMEITIRFKGGILRSEESSEDMYATLDKSIDVLERQMRKHKTKLEKRIKGNDINFINIVADEDESTAKIVRTKRFDIKPMSVEEASLQMELLGHSFFVFTNMDTEDVNVIYKRKDGNYGLIEPEF